MPTNAMGRDPQRAGNTGGGLGGSNADRDRAAAAAVGAAMGGVGRPQRTAHTDFITPKYGWGDASMRDFSIIGGGIGGIYNTIASGNTYAGRMPQGFASQGLGGNNERPGMGYGGGSDSAYYMGLGFPRHRAYLMSQGRMMGGTVPQQIAQAQQRASQGLLAKPAAPPQPQGLQFNPQTHGPTQISIPGALDYGMTLPAWSYFG